MNHGYDSALLERRAAHDKTAFDNVRGKPKARVVVVPCRRVIENLEELGLWEAFAAIDKAISIITAGLGAQAMDLGRVRGTGGLDYGADLLEKYYLWVAVCKHRYFSPLMVRDMILDGLTFQQIDEKYHFRKGTASKNLVDCLKLWD